MKAVVLNGYGECDVLQLIDVVDPFPGPEEVLIDIVTTALNRADLLQRRGLYPSPPLAGFTPPAPEIPGMEFSGRVAALGERVTSWALGEEVMGIVSGGSYAERLVIHEHQLMRIPATVSVEDAAAIPEVWITAFDALVVQGGLTAGRTALVHAGASGVGTAAIQICKAIGARVIVTASAGKLAACHDLGADLAVDYATQDFVAECASFTNGAGGRIVQVGTMGAGRTEVNIGMMLPKRASLIGTVLRSRPLAEKIAITQQFAAEILPLFDTGVVKPVIDSRYSLAAIADAHAYMETNANVGKILIDV
jgi:NADPH:quinone reductase-like Zn-dependent oxidoreductase